MNTLRSGVIAGLAYSLPVTIWLLTSLVWHADRVVPLVTQALTALFLAQALALVVFVPWFAERSGWRLALAALWLLLSFPLPLLAMAWATGAMDAAHLSLMESALVGFAVLLLGTAKGLVRLTSGQIRRFTITGLQLGTAALLWRFREIWLDGLGL